MNFYDIVLYSPIIGFIGTFLVLLIIMFNKIFRKQKLSVASIVFIILSILSFIVLAGIFYKQDIDGLIA